MIPGRNAPCPCGSGKKYKQCHGRTSATELALPEVAWQRLRAVLEGYPATMMRFVRETYDKEVIEEAWDEFFVWNEGPTPFDTDSPHLEVFLSWFFHRWTPLEEDTSVAEPDLLGFSPTQALLERRGRRLDPRLCRYLEACVAAPFSLHEVLRCDPGRGLRTRDLITGDEHEVLERSASRVLRPGHIVLAQVVSTDGISMFECCAPQPLPARMKLDLIDWRERVWPGGTVSSDELADGDLEVRGAYFDALELLDSAPPPRLQNTDGEDVVFHSLTFEIESAEATLRALHDLAHQDSLEDLLDGAEVDEDGAVHRVAFDWTRAGNPIHQTWENTVLGHIEIEGRALRARVNSVERAERLRSLLEERLGGAIRHERTETETLDEVRARSEPADAAEQDNELADLQNHPEVQAKLLEFVSAHYESWISEPVPALGDRTPLEAMEDTVGRAKVEALITDMERHARDQMPYAVPVFADLRKRLGLPPSEDGV